MKVWPIAAFIFALTLLTLTLWALAIGAGATCPTETGLFSCTTLVRPALTELGPLPVTPLIALGAATEALAALLLLARGAKLPFARDVAILAALGAGFALGLQPLPLLVVGRACLVCLLILACQLALSLTLAKVAKDAEAPQRPIALAFIFALVGTTALATTRGLAQRRTDEESRTALARVERTQGRILLIEKPGCPYCEALRLDLLAQPPFLKALEKTGLARREAGPGEPAPILVARDASGREVTRALGFRPDPKDYEALFQAATR